MSAGDTETIPCLHFAEGLRESTQALYRRTHAWLVCNFHGNWTTTEDLQEFLDRHAAHLSRVRLRTLQSIVNRHLLPAPEGPAVRVSCRQTRAKKADDAVATPAWELWVPRRVRTACLGYPTRTAWMASYVACLGPTALRRDRLRAYSGYVSGLLFESLGVTTEGDLWLLRREAVRALLSQHREHARRLCRIAWNLFANEVAFRDHPAQRAAFTFKQRDLTQGNPVGVPVHPATSCVRVTQRDHFTQSEVAALLELRGVPPRDRLVLRILAETETGAC